MLLEKLQDGKISSIHLHATSVKADHAFSTGVSFVTSLIAIQATAN